MAKWFDEARLCHHSMMEIGIAFYVREIMRNKMTATREELRVAFGQGWEHAIENLRRSGIMKCVFGQKLVILKIVSPGDRRREKLRLHAKKMRAQNYQKRESHAEN